MHTASAVVSQDKQVVAVPSLGVVLAFERRGKLLIGSHVRLSQERCDAVIGKLDSVASDWVRSTN